MVEHPCRKAGLLDHPVAAEQRADAAQVEHVGFRRQTADNDSGIGGIVADRVQDLARGPGFGILGMHPCVDDFDCRNHIVGGAQDIENRRLCSFQAAPEHKGQLDLDLGRDEPRGRNVAALFEHHVIQQGAVIGFGDPGCQLHRARGQANLVAIDGPAARELDIDPCPIDPIGILDQHTWIAHREGPNPFAGLLGVVEFLRQCVDQFGIQCFDHHCT